MDEISAPPSAPIEKAKNGREVFTDKIADEIVAACGSGFTLEKAGALVGNSMDGDFDTGNVRYKSRERYSFGWSDPLGIFGSAGS